MGAILAVNCSVAVGRGKVAAAVLTVTGMVRISCFVGSVVVAALYITVRGLVVLPRTTAAPFAVPSELMVDQTGLAIGLAPFEVTVAGKVRVTPVGGAVVSVMRIPAFV